MKKLLWLLTCVIFGLRLCLAFRLPLTGDEAYYWEWAQRPAFGYVDHPPAVAWTIETFAWLGRTPGIIRLGFWFCGVIATLVAADTARRLLLQDGASRVQSYRGAAQTAFFVSIAPMMSLAFTTASPDGPYLAAWAIVLDLACILAASATAPWLNFVGLGIALSAALMARAFGVGLVLGIFIGLRRQRRGLLIVAITIAFGCVPYLLWNAQHGFANILFTLAGRHVNEGFHLERPLLTALEVVAAMGVASSPYLLWFAALGRSRILKWSAIPLTVLFLLVALIERVETYWFLGPYLSCCILAATVLAKRCGESRASPRGFRSAAGFSYALTAFVLSVALAPQLIFSGLSHTVHLRLKNTSIFEIYTYRQLAQDVARIQASRHATVMTDGYGLSSLLDYEAGVTPVVIGYTWQGREARRWVTADQHFEHALFVDKEPLSDRPDIAGQLALACRHVYPGPVFTYTLPGIPTRRYPSTWCDGMYPKGIGILRWQIGTAAR